MTLSTPRLAFAALSAALSLLVASAQAAELAPLQFSGSPRIEFTQSNASGLAQTRRVVIASLVLEVQTRIKAEYVTGLLSKRVLQRNNTSSINSLKGYQVAALEAAADRLYARLQQQLVAAGYELVPSSELEALPAYQKQVAGLGYPSGYAWNNSDGNSFVVSPKALKLYVPAIGEQPSFSVTKKGVGSTDEPSRSALENMKMGGESSYSAGREVEIAKALNAHVLKAWYVVGFGSATAETDWDGKESTMSVGGFTTTTTTGATQRTGAAAQMYLREGGTRLALRHPNGDTAHARSARFGTFNSQQHAYDGDLVLRLDEAVVGSADFLADGGVQKKAEDQGAAGKVASVGLSVLAGLLGGSKPGDSSQDYVTQVDAEAFAQRAAEVVGWVQGKFVERLKP